MPWIIPKNYFAVLGHCNHHFSVLMCLVQFPVFIMRLSMHTLVGLFVRFCIRELNPCFVPSHDSVEKFVHSSLKHRRNFKAEYILWTLWTPVCCFWYLLCTEPMITSVTISKQILEIWWNSSERSEIDFHSQLETLFQRLHQSQSNILLAPLSSCTSVLPLLNFFLHIYLTELWSMTWSVYTEHSRWWISAQCPACRKRITPLTSQMAEMCPCLLGRYPCITEPMGLWVGV